MYNLSGNVALVTGATRGIGLEIANTLSEFGATVIRTGTKESKGDNLYLPVDFSSKESVQSFKEKLNDIISVQGIDICVNNAGINNIKPFEEYTDDGCKSKICLYCFTISCPCNEEKRFGENCKHIFDIWNKN